MLRLLLFSRHVLLLVLPSHTSNGRTPQQHGVGGSWPGALGLCGPAAGSSMAFTSTQRASDACRNLFLSRTPRAPPLRLWDCCLRSTTIQ